MNRCILLTLSLTVVVALAFLYFNYALLATAEHITDK